MTGIVVQKAQAEKKKNDIVPVELKELDGKTIIPIYATRFDTSNGNIAHKILFRIPDVEGQVFSSFTNDKNFNMSIDTMLDIEGVDSYTIPLVDQSSFKVNVRQYQDKQYVYLNL